MQIPIEFTNSQSWLLALQQRKTIAAAPATYILFQAKPFGRLCGTSNILYIGHTGQLGGESDSCRLRIYRYPNGSHAHELRHRTQQLINSGLDVRLCWTHVPSKTDAEALESQLLQQYLAEHGELPPFNSRC